MVGKVKTKKYFNAKHKAVRKQWIKKDYSKAEKIKGQKLNKKSKKFCNKSIIINESIHKRENLYFIKYKADGNSLEG